MSPATSNCYGQTVTEGSYMLLLNGSANRDETHFTDPDRFDIHRKEGHLSFGQGLHFCLGSALARLEARVAFEEVLKRWTDWDVRSMSASVVAQFEIDTRSTYSPFHVVPPSQHVPSRWIAATAARVASSPPGSRTST